ncbi:uncharacterized protein LOC109851949 [Pseudomyrmex gracilis]|uniref:uncharacterized protein LOC109851949 n=1 Tax=Pseudomyrmex gracilis TaxID=219809 RepID=UPI000994BF11|nr:uncharacterized protein LOC109851949 [Pseudomyrmex gracilis]
MKFLALIIAAVVIGTHCHSVTSTISSARDADETASANTLEQLKELIVSCEKNFVKLLNFGLKLRKTKNHSKQEIQFLNQLEPIIDRLVKEQSKVKLIYVTFSNDTDSILQALNNKSVIKSINNMKDIIDTMKNIDIVYQDGDITDKHIRIKRGSEGYNEAAGFASKERMTNMLLNIQNQVTQIKKYLDKLCKKHHVTLIPKVNFNDDNSTVNQPNKSIV